MNPLRRLARWLNPPDPDYRVATRVRTPDGSNRPITLVLGEDGLVWWEYADTEGEG